jgi:thymidine phosphorylase
VLPTAPVLRPIEGVLSGTLAGVDAEALGRASVDLGAGRRRKGDAIDPAVGVVLRSKVGDSVEVGQGMGEVHARTDADAEACLARVHAALAFADQEVEPPPLVYGWYG